MKKLLVITGPTATGKTALSVALAKCLNGEILSADAMQIYRGMEIGTAAATPEEQQGVPHHLLGFADPAAGFSVAQYQALAEQTAREIRQRGRLPIAVGGTGLYIDALCYDLSFAQGGADEALRAELQTFARENGPEALHERLRGVDPESAEKLHPNDQKRVIRALEIYYTSGEKKSDRVREWKTPKKDLAVCMIVLSCARREYLYRRIDRRVEEMMARGLEQEVRDLLAAGVPETAQSLQAIGYRELIAYFRGGCTREEAVAAIQQQSRRYAKRQLTWMKRQEGAHWLDIENKTTADLAAEAKEIIARSWQ